MGRKNSNSVKHRINRDRSKLKHDHYIAPTLVTEVEPPVGRCPKNRKKFTYVSEASAKRALKQAQRSREIRFHEHVEKRVYECEVPGCGWHLTSRERWTPRTEEA